MRIFGKLRPWLVAFGLAAGGFVSDLAADASKVTIGLQGYISPKCSLSDMAGQLDFGSGVTGRANRTASVDFTIDCNTPFIYRLTAQEGVMRLQGVGSSTSQAHASLPYDISLTIPTDDGRTLRAACGMRTLKTQTSERGCDVDSGEAVATRQRGQIAVILRPEAKLQSAGSYGDNIQVNLGARE